MFGARLFLLQVFAAKVLKNLKGGASVSDAQVGWQATGSIGLEVSEAKNVRFIRLNRVNHSKEWGAKPLV
jgi:hypothetical protein